jgi:hypothetical protein
MSTINGTKQRYVRVPSGRTTTGEKFADSLIEWKWRLGPNEAFCPKKSYMKLTCKLSKANGDQLTKADGIAPCMFAPYAIFQKGALYSGAYNLEQITDYLSQIESYERRQNSTEKWLEGVGNDIMFSSSSFEKRQNKVISDGTDFNLIPKRTDRTGLGFDAGTNQIDVDAVGVVTVTQNAGAVMPDLTTIFAPDDIIEIDTADPAVGVVKYRVSAVIDATTMQVNNTPRVVLGIDTYEFARIRKVPDRNVSTFELQVPIPLASFKQNEIRGGDFRLELTPVAGKNVYKTAFIESLEDVVPLVDFDFTIQKEVEICLYVYEKEDRLTNYDYTLYLNKINVSVDTVNKPDFNTWSANVPQNTNHIGLAFQDIRATTLSTLSPTLFTDPNNGQNQLETYQIQYESEQKPMDRPALELNSATDLLSTEWHNTITNNYSIESDPENYQEWKTRGPIYYHNWLKDKDQHATNVRLITQFKSGTDCSNLRYLLFAHYVEAKNITLVENKVARITTDEM